MSAFYVDDKLIIHLINAVAKFSDDGRIELKEMDRSFSLFYKEDRQVIAEILRTANVRSLKARYGNRLTPGELNTDITYKKPKRTINRVQGQKFLDCYKYQSCEFANWKNSLAYAICEEFRNILGREERPGYGKASWGWLDEEGVDWAE